MTDHYKKLYESFEWLVPNNFNIAEACCHRWAYNNHDVKQTAVFFEDQVGQLTMFPYKQLSEKVNKFANALTRMGVQPQDRVLIALAHSAESILSVLAVLTIGAIAVPVSAELTSPQYTRRSQDSQARVAIVDKYTVQNVLSSLDNHTSVRQVVGINTTEERVISLDKLLARQSPVFETAIIPSSTPALIVYPDEDSEDEDLTGVVLSHKALVGNLPGFVASQNWYPKDEDVFWSSYDWNSGFGLINAVMPAMYFGHSIVGCPKGRTIPRLFQLFEHYQVTNIMTDEAELQRIKKVLDEDIDAADRSDLAVRCIACPTLDKTVELDKWAQNIFSCKINGFYAPLGLGYVLGDCSEQWPDNRKGGSIGRVYPGRSCVVLDKAGEAVSTGQIGELYVQAADHKGMQDPAVATQHWQQSQLRTTIASDGLIPTGIMVTENNKHDLTVLN